MEDFPEQDERSFAPTPLRCLPHLAHPSEMGVVLAILFILFLCPGAGLLEGTFPGLWAAVCLVHTACFTPAQACFQGRFWRQESFPSPAPASQRPIAFGLLCLRPGEKWLKPGLHQNSQPQRDLPVLKGLTKEPWSIKSKTWGHCLSF